MREVQKVRSSTILLQKITRHADTGELLVLQHKGYNIMNIVYKDKLRRIRPNYGRRGGGGWLKTESKNEKILIIIITK